MMQDAIEHTLPEDALLDALSTLALPTSRHNGLDNEVRFS